MSDLPIQPGIKLDQKHSIDVHQKKIDDRRFIPEQYQKVAENMEQQFAEYMLQEMNKTVERTEEDSAGMDFYRSLQTTDQAKNMAKQDLIGLQNVILDQIYPKRLRNEMALKQYQAQAERIHHPREEYKIEKKGATIELGKNESDPEQLAEVAIKMANKNSEGDKP